MRNKDGTFIKGVSGNPEGKPKGTISEKSKIWNEIGEWFKGDGLEAYQKELMTMQKEEPKEFLKRYEAMLEYFAPKLQRTEFEDKTPKEDLDFSDLTNEEIEQLTKLIDKATSRKV